MFTLLDDGSKATSNMPSRLDPALEAGFFSLSLRVSARELFRAKDLQVAGW
jgi:glycosyltransferase A (GT-A) superfamily protein (DUF2064 family)